MVVDILTNFASSGFQYLPLFLLPLYITRKAGRWGSIAVIGSIFRHQFSLTRVYIYEVNVSIQQYFQSSIYS